MKILFIQLSDLHIKNRKGYNDFQIKKIIDSINLVGEFDKAIIVMSGDISCCGLEEQYKTAGNILGTLIQGLKRIKSAYVDVLCVPGNHDIFHGNNPRTNTELQNIYKSNKYDQFVCDELKKQKYFFNFAKFNYCSDKPSCFFQKILNCDGFKIETNLINTALFSLKNEEDKGLHFIPHYILNEINKPTECDFVITVMHHAPEWYIDSQKHDIEQIIFNKSSIVFYGHEHYINDRKITNHSETSVLVQCGGALCNNEDWTNSSFFMGMLDTNKFSYIQYQMIWNVEHNIYKTKIKHEYFLQRKPSIEQSMVVQNSFLNEIKKDTLHRLTEDFRDYYVFPRIKVDDSSDKSKREILSYDALKDEIIKKRYLLINGSFYSGKSALLKYLFLSLQNEYTVLYCPVDQLKGKKPERIIKNCFQDIFGDDDFRYEKFIQLPKSKKIFLIDDIDEIKPDSLDLLLTYIKDKFEYCVLTTKKSLDLNLQNSLKLYFDFSELSMRYQILPMYADKREELIGKVVPLICKDSEIAKRNIAILTDAITLQRQFISLDPDFIIKYVEYYCKNIGEVSENNTGVFSKVFEANITNLLIPFATPQLSVDKMYTILSLIGYSIHFSVNHVYPIQEKTIFGIIDDYNTEYDSSLNCSTLIDKFQKANILIYDQEKNGYRFENRNYLAFFVAREINRRFHDTADESDLRHILKYACFGINSDILMFLIYITDNSRVLKLIISMASEYTNGWKEFNFDENLPEFMQHTTVTSILPPNGNEMAEEKKAEAEVEKNNDLVQTLDIYDYSEDDIDVFVNQILRACALQITVARCLPNFEHILRKEEKQQFVDMLYSLPNKIFFKWASVANEEVLGLIDYIKQRAKIYEASRSNEITDEKVLHAIQWLSMSMLLNLYNISISFAAKENTYRYMKGVDFSRNEAYELEKLMILEKENNNTEFINEANKLMSQKGPVIRKTLIKRIVRHGLIHMPTLTQSQVKHLQSKYFPTNPKENPGATERSFIMERSKNQKRDR